MTNTARERADVAELLAIFELAAGRFAVSVRQGQRLVHSFTVILEAVAATPNATAFLGDLRVLETGLQAWRVNSAALTVTADALHASVVQLRAAPAPSAATTNGPVH